MSELRKRLEEVRERVKTSVKRVKSQIPYLEDKGLMGQIGGGDFKIGSGQISGVTEDVTKTAKEYVDALKEGKVIETLRFTPLRNRLEKRFPQLSKLPRIREAPPPKQKVAGLPPTPSAPKVREEALKKKKPEVREYAKRPAIF